MPRAASLNTIVVDDQLSIRSLVRSSLNSIGITNVREFASAADALEAQGSNPAHIIFSDYNMPGMDGITFLKAVRSDARNKTTAFILLTGRADRELVMEAAKAGANNYMVKPFTVASLKTKMEQVVGPISA